MSALAVPAVGHLFSAQPRSAAAGRDADLLLRRQLEGLLEFPARRRLFEELQELLAPEASTVWYGEDRLPVRRQAVLNATCFLANIPATHLDLEISPDSEGGLNFDWHRSEDQSLSIIIDGLGHLYYAAILGSVERVSGRLSFNDAVPEEILRLLRRVA